LWARAPGYSNDEVPKSYQLDLLSSTAFSNGIVGLQYRQHR
jgi:hypothetical protein